MLGFTLTHFIRHSYQYLEISIHRMCQGSGLVLSFMFVSSFLPPSSAMFDSRVSISEEYLIQQ